LPAPNTNRRRRIFLATSARIEFRAYMWLVFALFAGNVMRLREEGGTRFVHPHVTQHGPESWKVKCGIRPAEAFPMTDGGTLIMRNSPASSRHSFGETADQPNAPSIAPFAIDLEDAFEPARNSDAFGSIRHTSQFDYSRSTTNVSFWSGLVAGLATLGVGAAIAFIAFTSEPAAAYGAAAVRSPRALEHLRSSLTVETVEVAETRFVPKKKHRVRRATAAGEDATAEAVVSEAAPEPEPGETE
jgi:hypothetical protein